jgi:hypothetical protein
LGNGTELTPGEGVNDRLEVYLQRGEARGKRLEIVMFDFYEQPADLLRLSWEYRRALSNIRSRSIEMSDNLSSHIASSALHKGRVICCGFPYLDCFMLPSNRFGAQDSRT